MKKPIAIVFSDLHINNWSRFNEDKKRTLEQFRVLSILGKKSKKYMKYQKKRYSLSIIK